MRLDVGFDGMFAALLVGDTFYVNYHVQRVEDSLSFILGGGTFAVPAAPNHIVVSSGPYTTGPAGSGANFEIPPGFASGTFRILTHIHASNAAIRPIVSAFYDGLVVEVI
jgi:hypothetical protein